MNMISLIAAITVLCCANWAAGAEVMVVSPEGTRQLKEEVTTLGIHLDRVGHPINPTQYGVFFEEINHGGEGGLYAELIKNVSV